MSTLMHTAARENSTEEMKFLIVSGNYDLNAKDAMKRTPLHMACWAGNVDIVKLLLNAKAKTDALANDNFTPLHFATNVDIIKLLVKNNKQLLAARVSKGNKTALHIAVAKGNVEIVKCLIALGADVSAKTSSNQSALELAKSDEMYSVIKDEMQKKIDKQQEINDKKSQNKDDVSPYDSISNSSSINLDNTSIQDDENDVETDDIGGGRKLVGHSIPSNVVESTVAAYHKLHPELENNVINPEIPSIQACVPVVSDLPVHTLAVSSDSIPEITNDNDNISKDNEDSILGVRKMPSKISQKRKKLGRFSGQSFVLSHLNEDEDAEN